MSYTREWDISFPSDNRKKSNFADDIRNTRVDIGERYIDSGCFGKINSYTPVVPSGFGAVYLKEDGFDTHDVLSYIDDSSVEHSLVIGSKPMFIDSSGSPMVGYETDGTEFYSSLGFTVKLTVGYGSTSIAHGIPGDIVTNDKIYGLICSAHNENSESQYWRPTSSSNVGYDECYITDANIYVSRPSSTGTCLFQVFIIYKG